MPKQVAVFIAAIFIAAMFAWSGLWLDMPVAHAHGRTPATGKIVFHPTDPATVLVQTSFGAVITRDSGATWAWICREALEIGLYEDPPMVMTGDGTILSASFNGLLRGTDNACAWSYPSASLQQTVVIDAAPHPANTASAFVVTSPSGVDNQVFQTTDHGATWAPLTSPVASAPYLAESIAIAPSDPGRIYISGAAPPQGETPRAPAIAVSRDGGETFEQRAFSFVEGDRNIFMLAVDPSDPDRALMVARKDPAVRETDRLLLTTNAGETFSEVLVLSDITGAVFSADGQTVFVSSHGAGLYRSSDGGETYAVEDDSLHLGCVTRRGDELWVCADGFLDAFALARRTEDNVSFEPLMVWDDIGASVQCGAHPETTQLCDDARDDLERDFGRLDGGVGIDGGPMGTDDGGGDGGGCTITVTSASAASPWVLALALLAYRRSKRARLV